MSNMNPVVHFEMPYEDSKRVAEFYKNSFGWNMQMLGQEMGNYVLASTSETDQQTMAPKKPGMINGGFFQKSKESQYPSVVISVEDIHAAMKKVEEAGGKVIGAQKHGEPDDIPGIGLYISFLDTEGNRVGMLEPKGM